jgi:hypothetical protein
MFKKIALGFAGLSACVLLGAPPASARAVSANGFDPNYISSSCWGSNFPMTNTCSAQAELYWELPVDTANAKTVTVTVKAASSTSNVECAEAAMSADQSSVSVGAAKTTTVFGATSTLTLTGATVAVNGTLVVECLADPGSSIYSLSWNQ